MLVELTGMLDYELTKLGLKPGDRINGTLNPHSKAGALDFVRTYNTFPINCVVWPRNYIIIEPKPETTNPKPATRSLLYFRNRVIQGKATLKINS